jgi:hypothetical protein
MDTTLGVLKGIFSLFCPTDKDFGGEHIDLYNFRQREWRITGGISIGGQRLDRKLKDDEIKFLLSLDKVFFGKRIEYADSGGGERQRADECTIMPSVIYETKPKPGEEKGEIKYKPVQELMERIIVPIEALEEARKIAKQNSFECSRIVGFETAMDLAAAEQAHETVKARNRIRLLKSAKARG